MTPAPESPDAGERKPAEQSEGGRSGVAESRPLKPRFSFDVAKEPRLTTVTLSGELDVVCADVFRRKFMDVAEDEPQRVVIDLRGLTFLDSTGLALLLRVNEMSHDLGFGLTMVSSDGDAVNKIFRMTGTNAVLPLVSEPPAV